MIRYIIKYEYISYSWIKVFVMIDLYISVPHLEGQTTSKLATTVKLDWRVCYLTKTVNGEASLMFI
jgi:hypothetical protein